VQPDYLQVGGLLAKEGGGMFFNPFGSFAIAVEVKEPEAYAAALAKFWQRVEQRPAPIEEGFGDGVQAHRISLFGMANVVHAQRGDLVVLAHGDGAEQRAARLLAQKPGEPPAELATRKAQHPPGLHGCGRIDVRELLSAPPGAVLLMGMRMGIGEGSESPWAELIEPIVPLLEKHELHQAWTFAGWSEQRWRHRVTW
jgi:hypothetical protein